MNRDIVRAMTLDNLISTAADHPLKRAEVEAAASALGVPVHDLFDLFACAVGRRYLSGAYSYRLADGAMNHLFGFAYAESGVGLPRVAWDVYVAFDEGEHVHSGEADGLQGEARTRALLERLEALRAGP